LWMFYTLAYVPGGQPIGALERSFAKLAAFVSQLWKRRPGGSEPS
jgi:lipopolysaccharide export system permease protein